MFRRKQHNKQRNKQHPRCEKKRGKRKNTSYISVALSLSIPASPAPTFLRRVFSQASACWPRAEPPRTPSPETAAYSSACNRCSHSAAPRTVAFICLNIVIWSNQLQKKEKARQNHKGQRKKRGGKLNTPPTNITCTSTTATPIRKACPPETETYTEKKKLGAGRGQRVELEKKGKEKERNGSGLADPRHDRRAK